MRVACYNIMSGGFNGYDHISPEPHRLPELKIALQELGADVVGLVDTFRWDELFNTAELCQLFNYKYAFCINLNDDRLRKIGNNNGLTLLSNVPITNTYTLRIATRDALVAHLPGNIRLVLAYLDDLSEDTRIVQSKALVATLDKTEKIIIMGDLNTIKKSEVSNLHKALATVYKSIPVLKDKIGSSIADMQRGDVVALLESLGLQDADKTGSPTVPTKLFPVKLPSPFLRLDYCFHSSSVDVRNFAVRTQNVFQNVSDHFPIVFDMD